MYKFLFDQLVKSGIWRWFLDNFLAQGSLCESIFFLGFWYWKQMTLWDFSVASIVSMQETCPALYWSSFYFQPNWTLQILFFLLLHTLSDYAAFSNVHVVSHNNIYNAAWKKAGMGNDVPSEARCCQRPREGKKSSENCHKVKVFLNAFLKYMYMKKRRKRPVQVICFQSDWTLKKWLAGAERFIDRSALYSIKFNKRFQKLYERVKF